MGIALPQVAGSSIRMQPVREFGSWTADLERMADWLKTCGVEMVVLQSTGESHLGFENLAPRHGFEPRFTAIVIDSKCSPIQQRSAAGSFTSSGPLAFSSLRAAWAGFSDGRLPTGGRSDLRISSPIDDAGDRTVPSPSVRGRAMSQSLQSWPRLVSPQGQLARPCTDRGLGHQVLSACEGSEESERTPD
jgi:hypothetical protein